VKGSPRKERSVHDGFVAGVATGVGVGVSVVVGVVTVAAGSAAAAVVVGELGSKVSAAKGLLLAGWFWCCLTPTMA
jgi:hypothetical protein